MAVSPFKQVDHEALDDADEGSTCASPASAPETVMHPSLPCLAVGVWMLTVSCPLSLAGATVMVRAGSADRTNAVVGFPCTLDPAARWEMVDADGRHVPVQIENGTAWFLEPGLGKGQTRSYRLETAAAGPATQPPCQAVKSAEAVDLKLGDRTILKYVAGEGRLPRAGIRPIYQRGGYLHPVMTPSGRVVTDDYPPNHIHHHGIWTAWTKTEFEGRHPDFWNMGEGSGRVDSVGVDRTSSGRVFAGFTARHVFTDLLAMPPKHVLNETWTVRLWRNVPGSVCYLADLESEQECASASPLSLPEYRYGGLGYRGPRAWDGARNARYLDSNGVDDRVAAHGTRVRWYWFGGEVDGQLAGLAMLGSPANTRAPQPLRVHPDEPFICWSPSQLGDWEIPPGEHLVSRYRLVMLDGPPDAALLDRLWEDFADPPTARMATGP